MRIAEPNTASAPTDPTDNADDGAQQRERIPWVLAFLCFLIPALPSYVVLPGPLKSNGSPARVIAVMLFGLVVLGFVVVRRTAHVRRVSPGAMILLFYFLLWLTTYGVGLLLADRSLGWELVAASRTRAVLTLIANVGVGLYTLARVRTARQRDIVLGCLAAGLTFACLVGLLQVFSIDLRFLFRPPGLVVNTEGAGDVGLAAGLAERMGAARVVGTSQHAIEFSVLAAVTIPLTIYFARNAATRTVRFLSAAACGVAMLALPAAVSRSGVVSLAVALLIYMFHFRVRAIANTVMLGCMAVGGYVLAFPHIVNALWNTITGSSGVDESIQGRTADYAGVSMIFHEHPVFGLGLGGQRRFYDNEWLQVVVQGGLVGLAAMIAISLGAIFGIAAALRRAASPREREQAYMLGSVAAGILVSAFTFDSFQYQQVTLIVFIVFGILWSCFTIQVPEPNQHLTDRIGSSTSVSRPRSARYIPVGNLGSLRRSWSR
jgi:O-antigen ligase